MFNDKRIDELLKYLGEQLEYLDSEPVELVVSGGAALNALGLVSRTTKEIDCLAFILRGESASIKLTQIDVFPPKLLEAARTISGEFGLSPEWLNFGPTSLVSQGLPKGIEARLVEREYGPRLKIYFISRFDQIHFKLYAAVDQGGRHTDDLIKLNPTEMEIREAAQWCIGQDTSPAFRELLLNLLSELGFGGVVIG